MAWALSTIPKAKTMMTQRINERALIEATEAISDDLNELNSMMRSLIRDIRSARKDLAAMRKRREGGEAND